jgi:hypothetical protein
MSNILSIPGLPPKPSLCCDHENGLMLPSVKKQKTKCAINKAETDSFLLQSPWIIPMTEYDSKQQRYATYLQRFVQEDNVAFVDCMTRL